MKILQGSLLLLFSFSTFASQKVKQSCNKCEQKYENSNSIEGKKTNDIFLGIKAGYLIRYEYIPTFTQINYYSYFNAALKGIYVIEPSWCLQTQFGHSQIQSMWIDSKFLEDDFSQQLFYARILSGYTPILIPIWFGVSTEIVSQTKKGEQRIPNSSEIDLFAWIGFSYWYPVTSKGNLELELLLGLNLTPGNQELLTINQFISGQIEFTIGWVQRF